MHGFLTGGGRRGLEIYRRNGVDTGECSIIDFTRYVFSSLLRKCKDQQGHAGNIEIGVVIHRRVMVWYLCFTYTPLPTVSLILVRKLRARVSE